MIGLIIFFLSKQICLYFLKVFIDVDLIELIGFDRVNIFLVQIQTRLDLALIHGFSLSTYHVKVRFNNYENKYMHYLRYSKSSQLS
jgi:hypothetical protein